MNSLLRGLDSTGNDAIAYANDVAIAASDKLISELSLVLGWCRDFELSINPSKIDGILFSRRHKIPI